MNSTGNAFLQAAEALAQVRSLVLGGDQLRADLHQILAQTDALSKNSEQSLRVEIASASRAAQEVLQLYRVAAGDIAGVIQNASDQLETTATQIRATAAQAVGELKAVAETSAKRVAAESILAGETFRSAAKTLESTTGGAASQVLEASQRVTSEVTAAHARLEATALAINNATALSTESILAATTRVERDTSLHSGHLDRVSERIEQLLRACEAGAQAVMNAEKEIRSARDGANDAKLETVRAKDEIVLLRATMRRQLLILVFAVALSFMASASVFVWLVLHKPK
jgi:hypothetical protein